MKIVDMRASGYVLCFSLAATGAGCMTDLDGSESSISSAIVLDGNSTYTVVGVESNKCVGVVGASTATHARIDIETCNSQSSQRFRPESMGAGFFRLRNELSGLCLDVTAASLTAGTPVIQFTCGTGQNQQWSFADLANGAERITVRHSGQVFDVTGHGTADGTLLEQWPSNDGTNQQFTLTQALPAVVPDPE